MLGWLAVFKAWGTGGIEGSLDRLLSLFLAGRLRAGKNRDVPEEDEEEGKHQFAVLHVSRDAQRRQPQLQQRV